ncbi:MAG: hypothetical protein JXA22_08640 [Candidatus Thermoplasmatota archaeon]|nr:hypothetical protein [Candidatus Thermoplasmatota archaeon]
MGYRSSTIESARFQKLGVVVLAGNTKVRRMMGRRKRKGLFLRVRNPSYWLATREELESGFSSKINQDDYIVGENKSLLFLHPDLISQKNLNFFKRVLYFAGKTGDRFYRRNKKDLLEYLSKEGRSAIYMVVKTLLGSESVDPDRIIIVGPQVQLERELRGNGICNVTMVEQGSSLGENIQRGKKELDRKGYSGAYFLVVGGDVPMISNASISDFLESAAERGGEPDIFFGMGSRQEMGVFISEHGLDHMGKVGPNRPAKGNFNKFGIPLVDDLGIFGQRMTRVNMMMGNLFLYRSRSVDSGFINRFYSVRKMFANPFTLPYLAMHWARPLFRASRWRLTLSEAERTFKERTGIELRLCTVHPEIALDMDSYTDLRRLSTLKYHRDGETMDLELSFKEYLRKNKRKRKEQRKKDR